MASKSRLISWRKMGHHHSSVQEAVAVHCMRGWSTMAAIAFARVLLTVAISVSGGVDASVAWWPDGGGVPLCAGSAHPRKGTNAISIFCAGASVL
jgi:hypothetical protein